MRVTRSDPCDAGPARPRFQGRSKPAPRPFRHWPARLLWPAVLLLAAWPAGAWARLWTDSTGKHTVEAEMVGLEDGKVKLELEDGNTVEVAIKLLSREDRKYVEERDFPYLITSVTYAGDTGDEFASLSTRKLRDLPETQGCALMYTINVQMKMMEVVRGVVGMANGRPIDVVTPPLRLSTIVHGATTQIAGSVSLGGEIPDKITVEVDDSIKIRGPVPTTVQIWAFTQAKWKPVSNVVEATIGPAGQQGPPGGAPIPRRRGAARR